MTRLTVELGVSGLDTKLCVDRLQIKNSCGGGKIKRLPDTYVFESADGEPGQDSEGGGAIVCAQYIRIFIHINERSGHSHGGNAILLQSSLLFFVYLERGKVTRYRKICFEKDLVDP